MRYAIISDVHANLQAWDAVFTDIHSNEVDQIICLGDLVGYGPSPAQVLEQAYAHVHHFVLGNHDAVLAERLSADCFNQRARALIEWTRRQLDARASRFLGQLPYVLEAESFRCAHANPAAPAQFGYVLEADHASAVWETCPDQLVFIGHSHVPGFFIRGNSGIPHWLEPRDFALEEHKRYIVNVGSVGQPRGQDVRATYCLFDEGAGEVFFRQVPFDLAGYRTALHNAGVPDKTTHFLEVAARTEPRPLREMLDFSPPRADQVTDTDIGVAQLHRAVRSARRWRLGALLLFVLLVAGGGYLYNKRGPSYTEYAAVNTAILPAPSVGSTCLPALADAAGPIGPERSLADWTVRVMRPEAQKVGVELPEKASGRRGGSALPYLRLSSRVPEELTLISRPVRADAGTRFQLLAACKAQTPIEGYLELILMQTCADGTERMVLHYTLENIPRERWKAIRKSNDPEGLPEAGQVRWVFRGQFSGELLIRGCDLKRTR